MNSKKIAGISRRNYDVYTFKYLKKADLASRNIASFKIILCSIGLYFYTLFELPVRKKGSAVLLLFCSLRLCDHCLQKLDPPPPTRFNTDIAIVNFFRTKQVFCGTYVAAYSVYLVIFHLSLFSLALFIFVSAQLSVLIKLTRLRGDKDVRKKERSIKTNRK